MNEGDTSLRGHSAPSGYHWSLRGVGALFSVVIAGMTIGYVATGLPARLRMLWGLAALCGVASAVASAYVADVFRIKGTVVVTLLAVSAALFAFGNYGRISVEQFAALEAVESDKSKAARMFLEKLADEDESDSLLDPKRRWLQWRTKQLGVLEAPWPATVLFSELAACVLAAGAMSIVLGRKANSAKPNESIASETEPKS